MTIERFLKVLVAYGGIFLLFQLTKYLPNVGFYISLAILIAGNVSVMLWGLLSRVNGPSYPSTVRAKIAGGLRKGASAKP